MNTTKVKTREERVYNAAGILQRITDEYASLQSVEITNSAKDGPRVSVVKCYGVSGGDAADQAIATYIYACRALGEALGHPGHPDPTGAKDGAS